MRRVKFRPGLREQRTAIAHTLQFMASAAPEDKREAATKFAEESLAAIKPKRERAASVPTGEPLEADVITAVSQLLAAHPMILFAVRQNSGAASYEAASGRYAPVHFYRVLRSPRPLTIVDFWGLRTDGAFWALEAKRGSWTKPSGDREEKQQRFLEMVRTNGGFAGFVRSADEAKIIIES